ncbi:MAG: excinuclease ABC subunit UvrC [Alphaproteobacteria bacterium]
MPSKAQRPPSPPAIADDLPTGLAENAAPLLTPPDETAADDAATDDVGPQEDGPETTHDTGLTEAGGLAAGVEALLRRVRTLPDGPGVYRMLDAAGEVLYVGKARNLRRRVTSYTQPVRQPARLQRMIARTADLEVVTTHTEAEALLLESNLIKRLKPRFNVLLRDDKSFPYILIAGGHRFARLAKYRGARSASGDYFGPFASAGAVNRTLNALERAFLLRTCSDAMFANRTRPCLKYQLKRCSAPCVGHVDEAAYGRLVDQARAFLGGRSATVQGELARDMETASQQMDFETAALCRDRIRALSQVQARQDINLDLLGEADVVAAAAEGGQICIQIFFFRGGSNYGNRAYFPRHDRSMATADVMAAFIAQFYDNKTPPAEILVSEPLPEGALLAEALSVRAGRRVRLTAPQRGARRKAVDHALDNAREAAGRRMSDSASQTALLGQLAERFSLAGPPQRIEVYDNSHVSGTNPVDGMVVAGPDGPIKAAYRRFNIRQAAASDDFAMMREVLTRRFSRALKEDPERTSGQWPDLVLIDGGAGHLSAALSVLSDLGITGIALMAIAKGPDRDAGREVFHLPGQSPRRLPPNDPVLYYLQRLRDEAHRFAIGGHRARRSRALSRSPLDDVPGIGPARKRALLHRFGSAQAVSRAGIADLQTVPGISRAAAEKLYDYFRAEG